MVNHSHAPKRHWNFEEIRALVEYYPRVKSAQELLNKIPNHSLNAIKLKASALNLNCLYFLRISKDELKSLYIDQEMSSLEIAKLKGVTDTAIQYNLHKYQIPVRPTDESNKLFWKKNPPRTREKCSHWHGGKGTKMSGYTYVLIEPDNPFYSMAQKSGYVAEHRLIMAQELGRPLEPWEIVHHKGTKYPQGSVEDKGDNRIENLELFPQQASHVTHTMFKRELHKRDREIRLLKWQIKQLNEVIHGKKETDRQSPFDSGSDSMFHNTGV